LASSKPNSYFIILFRTLPKSHIPKRHLNFEEPICAPHPSDNTADRIYGAKISHPMVTETQELGTATNPADALPSLGRKTLASEAAVSIFIVLIKNERG